MGSEAAIAPTALAPAPAPARFFPAPSRIPPDRSTPGLFNGVLSPSARTSRGSGVSAGSVARDKPKEGRGSGTDLGSKASAGPNTSSLLRVWQGTRPERASRCRGGTRARDGPRKAGGRPSVGGGGGPVRTGRGLYDRRGGDGRPGEGAGWGLPRDGWARWEGGRCAGSARRSCDGAAPLIESEEEEEGGEEGEGVDQGMDGWA